VRVAPAMESRNSAQIPRAATPTNHGAVALDGKYLVSAFGVPQKAVPQVLHLVFPGQLRECQQTELDRHILIDLS
jgi:hypothetical protein